MIWVHKTCSANLPSLLLFYYLYMLLLIFFSIEHLVCGLTYDSFSLYWLSFRHPNLWAFLLRYGAQVINTGPVPTGTGTYPPSSVLNDFRRKFVSLFSQWGILGLMSPKLPIFGWTWDRIVIQDHRFIDSGMQSDYLSCECYQHIDTWHIYLDI